MSLATKSAFPFVGKFEKQKLGVTTEHHVFSGGMTLREYYAGIAMGDLVSVEKNKNLTERNCGRSTGEYLAKLSVYLADCLIEALDRSEKSNETD